MSVRKRAVKVKWILLAVLVVLAATEVICYYWMDDKIDDYRYNQPALLVTACSVEDDQFMVTVENPSAKRYRGVPEVYVLDTPQVSGCRMRIQPDSYYAEINQAGVENYDSYVVIPPKESVTLYYTLSEKDQMLLKELRSSVQELYAYVPSPFEKDKSKLQFYEF